VTASPTAKIIGSRALPCHGARAARLVVGDAPVTRACPVCSARYSIGFVEEPRMSERIGIAVYRLEISPWIDGRTAHRLRRESERSQREPILPFADPS